MKKFRRITILAAILTITGLAIQLFYDDRGFYLVILAFILSITNQIRRTKELRRRKQKDQYN